MLKPSVGIALEGLPYIIISAFTTLLFAILGSWIMTLLLLGITLFIGHFFRDPERVGPEDADAVCSPADGKVIKVSREEDPVTGEERQVIAVFMNLLNVHVNRMPVSGKIERIRYVPGKFVNASFDKAHKDNERNMVVVTGKGNQRFTVVQIAGLLARRIVCRVELNDKLKRGERFGLIKFGSRVDLYMPDSYESLVTVGDKVVAGETTLAVKRTA